MRVAHVNMSQDGVSCPQGLIEKVRSELPLCGQNAAGCQRTLFSALGLSYSRVYGRLQGYQFSTTDAFFTYLRSPSVGLSSPYVDGASRPNTSGHMLLNWLEDSCSTCLCPCSTGSAIQPPPFVGSDYYCETGNNNYGQCIKWILHQ